MANLSEKLDAEKEVVERFLWDLEDVLSREEYSMVEAAAVAAFLQRIYSGIENILLLILESEGVELSHSLTRHRELLDSSVSKGIIADWMAIELSEYLAFRQFFAYGHGYVPEEAHVKGLANNMSNVWSEFVKQMEEHVKTATPK